MSAVFSDYFSHGTLPFPQVILVITDHLFCDRFLAQNVADRIINSHFRYESLVRSFLKKMSLSKAFRRSCNTNTMPAQQEEERMREKTK